MKKIKFKYNKDADRCLAKLYASVGAKTWQQKYNTLILAMELTQTTNTFSHNPTWQQKATMMEYEYLEKRGLIKLDFC